MTRMTGPDCVVMCNLINTHTHYSWLKREPAGRGRMYGDTTRATHNTVNNIELEMLHGGRGYITRGEVQHYIVV